MKRTLKELIPYVMCIIITLCCIYFIVHYPKKTTKFLKQNIVSLTNGETSTTGYLVIHIPCYNSYGNHTGKYSATCSIGGPDPLHRHNCSECKTIK